MTTGGTAPALGPGGLAAGPGPGAGRVLPLLAAPASYAACEHDLLVDDAGRDYWVALFADHFRVQTRHALAAGLVDDAAAAAAEAAMRVAATALHATPDHYDRLDILVLDAVRRHILAAHGIHDEFRLIKARENERALEALPARLAELDALSGDDAWPALLAGLVAGNLFDMGAAETAARFESGGPGFAETLAGLPPRPWLGDDLEPAAEALAAGPSHVLVLVDNAGGDVGLGSLPLARQLVRAGARVTLAANAAPALNDVTARELAALLERAAAIDPLFGSDRLRVVDSGNRAPLIDLADVSEACAAAAADADFLVIQGMGRAIESNWSAPFAVPVLRAAILKDPQVAVRVGGTIYDPVIRFDVPAG